MGSLLSQQTSSVFTREFTDFNDFVNYFTSYFTSNIAALIFIIVLPVVQVTNQVFSYSSIWAHSGEFLQDFFN